MRESFGARLRQRRERQQISLTAIAEQTKIKSSLLEALERDDVSHWPVGIFRRAFIRAYAHAIGLEPDAVVQEFLALHPDPTDEVAALRASASGREEARPNTGPPTRLRSLLQSAVGTLSGIRRAHRTDPAVLEERAHVSRAAYRPVEPDLLAAAQLCTDLSRASSSQEVMPLLQEAVRILDAVGLVVWVWHAQSAELQPALACGYSEQVRAQLPAIGREAHNATAEAFRSAQVCTVAGNGQANSALVAPLMTPWGCQGVLAIELQDGRERTDAVRALVTIVAAQLARWNEGHFPALIRPSARVIGLNAAHGIQREAF